MRHPSKKPIIFRTESLESRRRASLAHGLKAQQRSERLVDFQNRPFKITDDARLVDGKGYGKRYISLGQIKGSFKRVRLGLVRLYLQGLEGTIWR